MNSSPTQYVSVERSPIGIPNFGVKREKEVRVVSTVFALFVIICGASRILHLELGFALIV